MRGQSYVIITIIFIILIAIFAIMNVETVDVKYLFWTIKSPLILVILFSVLMGGIVTGAAGAFKIIELQRKNKSLQRDNGEMELLLKKNNLIKKEKQSERVDKIKNEKDD